MVTLKQKYLDTKKEYDAAKIKLEELKKAGENGNPCDCKGMPGYESMLPGTGLMGNY